MECPLVLRVVIGTTGQTGSSLMKSLSTSVEACHVLAAMQNVDCSPRAHQSHPESRAQQLAKHASTETRFR